MMRALSRHWKIWLLAVGLLGAWAAMARLPGIGLGASAWEPVLPAHLAALPELQTIAPHIRVDAAVVYGFQDKVYRFQFTPSAPEAFAVRLHSGAEFAPAPDAVSALTSLIQSFSGIAGEPPWWRELARPEGRRATLYVGVGTTARSVVLANLDGRWYGQITEF
jgi:hypothetical protein